MNIDYMKRKGSLTIEAALVLPLFLFAVFSIMSLINLFRFHINLNEELHQVGKEIAMEAFIRCDYTSGYVKNEVLSRLGDEVIKMAPIEGGAEGIDFSGCDFSDREIIRLKAEYKGLLPYDIFNLFEYDFSVKCTMHSYIGYEKGIFGKTNKKENEEYVYITENGTVYHRNRECSYLRLSIKEVNTSELVELRNTSGHKYYACEKCGKKAGNTVYITDDGTCYHSSLGCSGLKRTVKCVPISEVGGRGPCSRCGHAH